MADQVTDRIEKALREVPFADKIRSFSRPGESFTILQVKDSTPPRDVANSFYQARKRVGDMRGTLPAAVIADGHRHDSTRSSKTARRVFRPGTPSSRRLCGACGPLC